jgi:hypothetical protein
VSSIAFSPVAWAIQLLLLLLAGASEVKSQGLPQTGYRLDRVLSSSELDLTAVGDFFDLPDGRFVIGLPRDREVWLAPPRGEVQRIGRRGSGPGEYRNVSGVGAAAGGLWVADLPSAISMFDLRGRIVETIQLAPNYSLAGSPLRFQVSAVLGARSGGSAIVVGRGRAQGQSSDAAEEWAVLAIIRQAATARRIAGMRVAPCAAVTEDGRRIPSPFCASPIVRASPSGAYLLLVHVTPARGPSTEVRFQVIDTSGVTSLDRRIQLPTPGVSDRDRRWYADHYASLSGTSSDFVDRFLAASHPQFHPSIRDAVIGNDGAIWARLHAPTGQETIPWRRIHPSSPAAPDLLLPSASRVGSVSAAAVLVTSTDADGLPELHRYTLRP